MTHIRQEQKDIMLEFIKARPKLYAGKFSPDFTQAQSRCLWQELATILNAHPNGAKKEWSAWRKTWIDIKKNSKAKLAKERKHQKGTGGGPPETITSDSYDHQVMELTSPVCVTGNLEIPEPSIIIDDEVIFEQATNQIETESQQNIEIDHAYIITSPGNGKIDPPKQEKYKKMKMTHPLPEKSRVTKSMRLNESIKNHKKMVNISERAIIETNTYRSEKLQVLREQHDELSRQNSLLENISSSFVSMVDTMREFL